MNYDEWMSGESAGGVAGAGAISVEWNEII